MLVYTKEQSEVRYDTTMVGVLWHDNHKPVQRLDTYTTS